MQDENSALYVGKTISGTVLSVMDYATRHAGLEDPPTIHCPRCEREGDYQPLIYNHDWHNPRFVHAHVNKDCYKDDTKTRGHHLIQQLAFQKMVNSPRYDSVELEYTEIPGKRYDVRAGVPDAHLAGVVVEVQHGCGRFRNRISRTVELAHRHDHAVYIIISPYADARTWIERRLNKGMSVENPQAGRYRGDTVELGTRIDPGAIDLFALDA